YWKACAEELERENMELRLGALIAEPALTDDPGIVDRYLAAGGHRAKLTIVEWWRRGEPIVWVEDLPVNADTIFSLKKQRDQAQVQARHWRRKSQGGDDPKEGGA